MKYIYHVYTPFSRWQNLVPFTKRLDAMHVHWHPIFDEDVPFIIAESDWIHPLYCVAKAPGWEDHMGHFKGNFFFDNTKIQPEHRYMGLCDDDMVEPDFFLKIDRHDGEVIICTALRGHHQPATGPQYGTGALQANAESLKPGLFTAQQMISSGLALGHARYDSKPCGDFRFAEQVFSVTPPEFAPEANVWFNAYEPGRWDHLP